MSVQQVTTFAFTLTPAGSDIDIWQLLQANNRRTRLRGFLLGQTSETGDAAEEGMALSLLHITGSTGVTEGITVLNDGGALDDNDTALVSAVWRGNTLVGTGTVTTRVIERIPWNIRNGPLQRWYLDRFKRIALPIRSDGLGQAALVLRRDSSITDDISVAGALYWEVE